MTDTSSKSKNNHLEQTLMPEPSLEAQKSTFAKSVFLLPSLMTLASMFAGFYAIIAVMHGRFIHACLAIFIAMLFDALDGRLARLTNTQTEFGAQLDSIADMVSFGVAPAVLLYVFALAPLGKIGWLLAFLYAACTGLRLAKFNIAPTDKSYFYGLATPAAAAVVASLVWVIQQYHLQTEWVHNLVPIITVILALLKVSSVPYHSFKDVDLRAKVSLLAVIILMIIFILIWDDPARVLLIFATLYAISGPVFWCVAQQRKKEK